MVQEFSVPTQLDIPADAALVDAVTRNAESMPDRVVFSRKTGSGWEGITAKDFASQVHAVAAGLVAAGVGAGDRVALMSRTRFEWTVCDYAIWTAGAVTVPVYETSSAEQIEWIISDSGSVWAILETADHLASLDTVRDKLADLKGTSVIEAGGLDELAAGGREVTEATLAERRATLSTASLATIVYTSGTTGKPKGCELTHGNLLFDIRTTKLDLGDLFNPERSSTLMFLPIAHVFGRVIQCGCVESGVRLGHTSDIKNLLADFAEFKPTFILSVPRVFEKVYNTSRQLAHSDSSAKGQIFDRAEAVAIAFSEAADSPGGPGLLLKLQHAVFDRLVYSKLRAAMGGQIEYAVSGGAPLGLRLGHFFRGIGVTILEGYGLTESAAGATVNRPDKQKIGTVGTPIGGASVKIAEDGEVLLKGRNIFRGYWKNEKASAEVLDGGWFRTGDIGKLDDQGYLSITGRKKELIVTAGGKNVAPAVLEDRLRAHPLVSQCMVVGDNKPFIGALVTIDADFFGPWKASRGKSSDASVASLTDDADLRAEIQTAVDDANKAVSHAEAIKVFRILPEDFSEEGGEMTPSLKVKRNVVLSKYATEVDAIYASKKPE